MIHVKYKPSSNFLYVLWKSRCKKAVHDQIASLCFSSPLFLCVPLMTWLLWEWIFGLWNACVLWLLVSKTTTCSPPQRVCILLELELSCPCRILCVFSSGLPLGPVISWLSKESPSSLAAGYYLAPCLWEILPLISIPTRGWERKSNKSWNSNQCLLLLGYSSGKWRDQGRRKLKLSGFHSHLDHFPKALLGQCVWE